MGEEPVSRVVYRNSHKRVVVKYKGREIARYRNAGELVEVHMKGMMAIDAHSAKQILKIYNSK